MVLEVLRFLHARNVEYKERGPNVARGHVNIKCPFCGDADPSHHMGIRLSDGVWGCFRNPGHRGRSAARLIAAVVGCDWRMALAIAEEFDSETASDIDDLRQRLDSLDEPEPEQKIEGVEWPNEMRAFSRRRGIRWPEDRFRNYLRRRGFHQSRRIARYYGLRWTVRGRWAHRVVFPLKGPDRTLYGWTGRAIGDSYARYKTYPENGQARDLIWNADRVIEGGRNLMLCEGPIDGMKLDWYGEPCGLRAVSLLGLSCGPVKQEVILELASRYDQLWVCLDEAALARASELTSTLTVLGARLAPALPGGAEDPGALSAHEVKAYALALRT